MPNSVGWKAGTVSINRIDKIRKTDILILTLGGRQRISVTQRAIDGPYIYFVTTNTTYWLRILDNPEHAWLLGRMIKKTCQEFGFTLYAFSILPDHLHLLVKKSDTHSLSKLMKHIKGRFSRNILPGRVWKPRFNFHIIESERYFSNVVRYIQYNYKKTGIEERFGYAPYVFIDWVAINRFLS